ncbi:zinc finger and BTB domain-containing protein 11 isoform X2 [Amyelois transitella]|uniref:zinc finger and BTB domain-containing protein 11 isoform X2 n=1 Tax=Amyelois transitella TaxID=680683 RepID=UPI00298F807D|nr:zinc finger and BTB domain-containing protein 11 isoform X2 [Amyelois transitella]
MMAEIWKIEKDLCRCCHSEGIYQKLSDVFDVGERQGIFSDIIWRTLGIRITSVEEPLHSSTYSICDACIVHLKDATVFKLQIRECERIFQDMYAEGAIIKAEAHTEIKQEPDTDEQSMDTGHVADVFNNDDDEAAGNDDVHDDAPGGDETECELKIDIELCNEQPEAETKRRSARSRRAALKDTKTQPKIKSKPKAKKKNVALENGSKKGTMPAFRLTDEDYWRDGDVYHCARCDKTYTKFFSLRCHVKNKHYKIPRFTCPYCVAKFMTAAPLTVHKLQEHNIDDRFKCNACKGTFNTKVQLRKHINNFHMLGEKHKCEFCDYESFSFEGLYKHKVKHKTVKDYHCRFCRKSFLRKTNLDLHERIHTGDRRKICKVCSQAFVQKASLNYHMTKYHPEVNF